MMSLQFWKFAERFGKPLVGAPAGRRSSSATFWFETPEGAAVGLASAADVEVLAASR